MQEKKTKICSYCGKEITDGKEYIVMDGGELYHTECLNRKELNGSGLMIVMAAISAAVSIAIVFFVL